MLYRRKTSCRGFPVLIAILAISCALTVGCDRTPRGKLPRGDITVTVTYGADPVTEGQVDLNNVQTGEGGGGFLNGQGIATLARVVEGTYVVTVNPPHPNVVIPGQPAPATKRKESPNIPQKFREVATSPLQADVKQGESGEYRFDLKEIE